MMFLANNGGGGSKSSGGGGGGGGGGGLFGMFGGGGSDGGGKKDPMDLAKQWKRDLQKEIRRMDRDIQDIKRAEQKSMVECKALAKKGRLSAVKVLAKEIANTRRTVERMYMAKAQLNSVSSTLQTSMCKIIFWFDRLPTRHTS
jgi:charged multivesicular body protein 3